MCVHALLELFLFGSSAMAKLKQNVTSVSRYTSFHIRPKDKTSFSNKKLEHNKQSHEHHTSLVKCCIKLCL